MDLIWQRQVELWLRLCGHGAQRATPRTQLHLPAGECWQLEQWQQRALLSVSRPLAARHVSTALPALLLLLAPEATGGVPVRAWLARQRLWLAASMPPESDALLWYEQTQILQQLLVRALRSEHGDLE